MYLRRIAWPQIGFRPRCRLLANPSRPICCSGRVLSIYPILPKQLDEPALASVRIQSCKVLPHHTRWSARRSSCVGQNRCRSTSRQIVHSGASSRCCEEYQRSLTQSETSEQRLDFSGRQHAWCGSPLCTLADQTDRLAIEQFVTASMIEKDREEISDFRTTALREWQTAQPRFHLDRSDFGKTYGPPMWDDPSVQISLVTFLSRITAPDIVLSQFALLKVIAH